MLYHRGWYRAVETARSGLNASLLVRHPETNQLFVNFDPQILELIQEARYLKKMQLDIPESAYLLAKREAKVQEHFVAYVIFTKNISSVVCIYISSLGGNTPFSCFRFLPHSVILDPGPGSWGFI